jgi:hypothetical protein
MSVLTPSQNAIGRECDAASPFKSTHRSPRCVVNVSSTISSQPRCAALGRATIAHFFGSTLSGAMFHCQAGSRIPALLRGFEDNLSRVAHESRLAGIQYALRNPVVPKKLRRAAP